MSASTSHLAPSLGPRPYTVPPPIVERARRPFTMLLWAVVTLVVFVVGYSGEVVRFVQDQGDGRFYFGRLFTDSQANAWPGLEVVRGAMLTPEGASSVALLWAAKVRIWAIMLLSTLWLTGWLCIFMKRRFGLRPLGLFLLIWAAWAFSDWWTVQPISDMELTARLVGVFLVVAILPFLDKDSWKDWLETE